MTIAAPEHETFLPLEQEEQATSLWEKHAVFIKQILISLIAITGGISTGLLIGFSSVSLPQLTNQTNTDQIFLTPDQASWFASLSTIISPIGCLLGGPLSDHFGRKATLLLLNLPCLLGWTLLATVTSDNLAQLYLGRVFCGLTGGMASIPATVYLGEIASDTKIRSMLMSWTSISITLGILIVYVLGSLFRSSWQIIAAICGCLPLLSLFLTYQFLPESPLWLIAKNKPEMALESLRTLRGVKSGKVTPLKVKQEYDAMVEAHEVKRKALEKAEQERGAVDGVEMILYTSSSAEKNNDFEVKEKENHCAKDYFASAEKNNDFEVKEKENHCARDYFASVEKNNDLEVKEKENHCARDYFASVEKNNDLEVKEKENHCARDYFASVEKNNDFEVKEKENHCAKDYFASARVTLHALCQWEAMKPLLITNGLFLFQQISGYIVITYYSVDLLLKAGVKVDPYLASILLGLVQFVSGAIVSVVLTRCGRRPMGITGGAGMSMCMIGLGLNMQYKWMSSWFPLTALTLLVIFSMIGFRTVPWSILGEIYPLNIKGVAVGITTCNMYLFSFATVKLYPLLVGIFNSTEAIFYFYGATSTLGTIYVILFQPETHRKSLEQIQIDLHKKKTPKTRTEKPVSNV